jgi:O-antigen ligase
MREAGHHGDIRFTRRLFYIYLLLLFFVPIPLGSNRSLYWSVFVALVAVLGVAWCAGWVRGVTRWPGYSRSAARALAVLAIFTAWASLQLLPAAFVPAFLTPAYITDAYSAAGAAAPLGADIQATRDNFVLTVGLLLLASLTVVLVRSRRRALLVLYTLVLAGLFQALYGGIMVLSGLEYGFLEPKQFGRGVATGTYINRNHYANLLALSLSAGTGLLLARMDFRESGTLRQRLRGLLEAALGSKARLRVYMVITVIALVLTRSRMGNASFFIALTLVGGYALWRLKLPRRPLLVFLVSVLLIDLYVVGNWFGFEQVVERLQTTVQTGEGGLKTRDQVRLDASRESLEILGKAPVLGTGGGSFYTVYPAWRGADQGFMDHAHNDYLEFAVEYGLTGVALLAVFLWLCARGAIRGLHDRDRKQQFGISFASLMAMVAMLIHSAVDFSLHIPANAAWFVVLCVLPLCTVSSRVGKGTGSVSG